MAVSLNVLVLVTADYFKEKNIKLLLKTIAKSEFLSYF